MFVIHEKPHPTFKREGNDLVYTHRLPLVDALAGTTLNIPHLDGSTVRIPVDEVRHGHTVVLSRMLTTKSSSSAVATFALQPQ